MSKVGSRSSGSKTSKPKSTAINGQKCKYIYRKGPKIGKLCGQTCRGKFCHNHKEKRVETKKNYYVSIHGDSKLNRLIDNMVKVHKKTSDWNIVYQRIVGPIVMKYRNVKDSIFGKKGFIEKFKTWKAIYQVHHEDDEEDAFKESKEYKTMMLQRDKLSEKIKIIAKLKDNLIKKWEELSNENAK